METRGNPKKAPFRTTAARHSSSQDRERGQRHQVEGIRTGPDCLQRRCRSENSCLYTVAGRAECHQYVEMAALPPPKSSRGIYLQHSRSQETTNLPAAAFRRPLATTTTGG